MFYGLVTGETFTSVNFSVYSQMILLIQSKLRVKIRNSHQWPIDHSLYTTDIVSGLPVVNLGRDMWHMSGKKEIYINAEMEHLLFKSVSVSVIYTHT